MKIVGEPAKVITEEEDLKCGCHRTQYVDETGQIRPCAGHAMKEAARLLLHVGELLGTAGAKMAGEEIPDVQ